MANIEDVTDDPWEWHKFWYECDEDSNPYVPEDTESSELLTNELLKASQCKTREEAQLLIQRADNISQKMSGTCYGFEYNNEEHIESFKVTHH